MTGLYVMLWAYSIVAAAAILGCLWTMWAGLATGRHRRRRASVWTTVWRDLVDGLKAGMVLIYRVGL